MPILISTVIFSVSVGHFEKKKLRKTLVCNLKKCHELNVCISIEKNAKKTKTWDYRKRNHQKSRYDVIQLKPKKTRILSSQNLYKGFCVKSHWNRPNHLASNWYEKHSDTQIHRHTSSLVLTYSVMYWRSIKCVMERA